MFEITPHNSNFVFLSFEGPDPYSQAGGLGVRVTELARCLVETGFPTQVIFVGDPNKPAVEEHYDGRLIYRRWSQWISKYHPQSVYDGEEGKLSDYGGSVPPFVVNDIVYPYFKQGKVTVVMAEEWQTAGSVIYLEQLLYRSGLRDKAILLWNANNNYSFWRIDWKMLKEASTITTISRYMKHMMWETGVNPLTIANGIPRRMLEQVVDRAKLNEIRSWMPQGLVLAKVGRFHPDKRWMMAIESVALLKQIGLNVKFIIRGDSSGYGKDLLYRAGQMGLKVLNLKLKKPTVEECVQAVTEASHHGDVINMDFFVPEEFLRILYGLADAVLANSGKEPFGLVGLEVMAAGGIPVTGSTGEDYAKSLQNAIVIETEDPWEIVMNLIFLERHPNLKDHIRHHGQQTAQAYVWDNILLDLLHKINYAANLQHVGI